MSTNAAKYQGCLSIAGIRYNCLRGIQAAPVVLLWLVFGWCFWAYLVRLCGGLLHDGQLAQGILYIIFFQPLFILCIWSFWKVTNTPPGRPVDVTRDQDVDDREDVQLLNHQQPQPEDDGQEGDEEGGASRTSVAILDVGAANESRVSLARASTSNDAAVNMRNVYPLITVKRSGAKRFCKKCQIEKFDRTHHCRICKSCTLKMDHHCPWVNNCVGFFNYKFFYLFILYASLLCLYVFLTTLPPTIDMVNGPMSIFGLDFNWPLLLFISGIFGLFLLPFTIFHTRQILKNRTTIETYEKANFKMGRSRNGRVDIMRNRHFNPWDLGYKQNFRQVMGNNPMTWFLPMGRPQGQGNYFPINEYAYNTLSTEPDDQFETF
ncbi:hypothetical protein LRAMOSA08010 [Lichtheimia ramosa]|uniref:Palmitoyltransferase n=1 Tax=Lichtheimia ramosa TaxID=688394 RepID=A0A077WFS7_9FUNG|nr:hypothetical protein LRAMOSA08010 [Lichtheimia ramosa]